MMSVKESMSEQSHEQSESEAVFILNLWSWAHSWSKKVRCHWKMTEKKEWAEKSLVTLAEMKML